ncbi:alanine/glycine:cation symporter family protein [Stutzerimonas kunmingensis]|jgi:AGCS family alanine or glycine:cation symporter|uniref:Sodium:alanine symporter family protein n=1 Tax=Stutzerimonas kunmingensis TaxID=1211807 RepID=A0A9X1SR70_9GAMM|nr:MULTISPECIES: sodium:alanine symporter family protein [Stutzerimonas stutzeri subgroup]KJS21782.1 MAG: sodium:alanine symporter [Pseudomonas sp. BRH_c35]KKJ96694.1 sodium:alanine symporter [Stutzerimonas stutzeri]MAF87377.1 sodium:alanine symporter family protein [Pseudomonas sp.]MBU2013317.1 sodium:alanine symporter family protein [Gammaproteobacteria bacterium]MCB4795026.1 sodium:alanine symporter family protein [Pseudomonas sp. NP21570]RRU91263.1 sodium:alanine symporter family protein |tara:strand:- start:7324 stop:8667 length:1344 start_codon:yes stop_codon:yes gene_type:complete
MEFLNNLVNSVNGLVWGPPMLVLILGTGLFLMIFLKFMPLTRIPTGFALMWRGRTKGDEATGEISPFQALMTSLAATVGTGNIAGVATAIFLGGPGALFWMWCTALVGMATKYCEVVLAVHYREKDDRGEHVGGPMYAIKNGLGKKWIWLGTAFAIFGGLAGFGIGNMVQVNSMAHALETTFSVPLWATGLITMVIVGLVILGGIRRIGVVAASLVPFMCLAYLIAAAVVLVVNASAIPAAFDLIFTHAFTPIAATGGFAGAAVMAAIRFGVARGIFSNEAGLGTAGIAQAAGTTTSSVRSGMIGMLGTFIDTIIVCSMTGLAIICTGVWTSGESGAALSAAAFESAMPGIGGIILTLALVVFAFTTILGWSYFGEKCWEFLVGTRAIWPFRVIWVLAVPFGAIAQLDFAWLLADTLNGLMAIPNLVSLLLLSPVVVKLTKEYFARS